MKQILLWTRLLLGSLIACSVVHADTHASWRLVHGNPAPSVRIHDLEYALGRWVVVGDQFTGWSDDGFKWNWTRRTDAFPKWGAELKIVVGFRADGSPLILAYPVVRSEENVVEYLSSVDGVGWEDHRLVFENSSERNYKIIPNPSHERPWLLTVGDGNQPVQIYQSADGHEWHALRSFVNIRDIQWGNEGLLVLTSKSLSYTDNLKTWVPVTVSNGEMTQLHLAEIGFHSNKWMVQSWGDGLWWSSLDLKNWDQEPDFIESAHLLDFSAQPDLVGALRPNERLMIGNDQTWLEVPWEMKNSRLLGVDVGKEDEEGVFVMVGLSFDQNIYATDNKRLNWSPVPEGWSLRGSHKERKPEYYQQSDNWSEEGEVLHSNGTWVVRTAFSELLVSRDGLSWDCVNCSPSDGEDIRSIAYDGEKWLRAQKHHLLLSDDLVNWNRIGPDMDLPTPKGYVRWNLVDFIDGQYFALGKIIDPGFCDDILAVVYTSSDLLRWRKLITLRNASIHSVNKVYGNWLILGRTLGACEGSGSSYGVAWTSSDLLNWDFHSLKREGLFQYGPFYEGVSGSDNDWLLAVSGYETGGIYQLNPDYSIDRLPEIEHDEDEIVMYNDIRFVNQQWVAIGSISEFSDGETFRDYFIQTSSDALRWETRFSSSELVLQKVYFAEGEWLVTEAGGALLRSENGLDWILESLPGGIRTTDAVYSGGHWVLVGENGTVLVEPDALTGKTGLILETHENQMHLSWMGNFPPHGAWIEWSEDLKQWQVWETFEAIQHTEPKIRYVHKTPIYSWESKTRFYRVRY